MSNKWSSFGKQQMIMENWRKFTEGELLTEKANAAVIDPDKVPGAIETAVTALKGGEVDVNEPYGQAPQKKAAEE